MARYHAGPGQIAEILEGISAAEPVLAEQLKTMIFSFEDISGLSQKARMRGRCDACS